MSQATSTVVHAMKRLAMAEERTSDAQLLRAYADNHDEEAFLHLMRRHGPMVLGVCRRWLGSSPDAEDAFQTTFIVLSQKAARIKDNLPGWLHQVAQRTARKVLRHRSQVISTDCDRRAQDDLDIEHVEWRDLRRALDEELERLPSRERSSIVLCLVEGLTRDEAAERLGVSVRTVDRSLQRGRASLRGRLQRRGLALLTATLLPTEGLVASVPLRLSEATLREAIKAAPPKLIGILSAFGLNLFGILATTMIVVSGMFVGEMIGDGDEPAEKPFSPEKLLVMAPTIRNPTPPDPWGKKIAPSSRLAIDYLKSVQANDGTWEDGSAITLAQPGGQTALISLALLESGVKASDPVLEKSVKYLRQLPLKHTYVVSLNTQLLCLTGDREDKDHLQKQVDWLLKAQQRNKGKLEGWSYSDQPGRGDFSNTQYAITALTAAHRSGIKIEEKLLQELQELLLETQLKNGGWAYTPQSPATHTMTCSSMFCLRMVDECLGDKRTSVDAMKKGWVWLEKNYVIENNPTTFYNLDVLSRLGRVTSTTSIKDHNWFQEGFDFITANQAKQGAIRLNGASLDSNPKLSTPLALRFYANRIRN
jgi:RNA polymerase sigma factor (sigma-70 family)